jgi:hypothetical protein
MAMIVVCGRPWTEVAAAAWLLALLDVGEGAGVGGSTGEPAATAGWAVTVCQTGLTGPCPGTGVVRIDEIVFCTPLVLPVTAVCT